MIQNFLTTTLDQIINCFSILEWRLERGFLIVLVPSGARAGLSHTGFFADLFLAYRWALCQTDGMGNSVFQI